MEIQLQYRIINKQTGEVVIADGTTEILASVTLAPLDPPPPLDPLVASGDTVDLRARPFTVAGIPIDRAEQYHVGTTVTVTVAAPDPLP